MIPQQDSYAEVASFYEAEYGRATTDVAYYGRHGLEGPLLVLGCGTGRVGRALGTARAITGLDSSPDMLALARRLAPEATYLRGDLRDFDLGEFAEIIVPNGAFNFLQTRADQNRCLWCCHRTLPPGGPLTIDMPMPDFGLMGTSFTPERRAWEGEVDGRMLRRTREVHRRPVAQQLEIVDRYYVGDQLVATSPLRLRFVFPAEVEWMLEAVGFYVEAIHGDFADGALRENSPRLLVRAVRL